MRIVTYQNAEGDAPEGTLCVARIILVGRNAKGKPVDEHHPVIIYASSLNEARDKAQAWWDEQLAKEQRKADNARASAERLANARKPKAVQP